ncbi:MAG: hypothetical protein EHM58_03230 [Ignavibacteriae bacterium]|nr:MAG: hypothetical protein EHM58_03230 [Ignavibacteriota bacterium]
MIKLRNKKEHLLSKIMDINLISKNIAVPNSSIRGKISENDIELRNVTEDDIELIVYSFLIHERSKLPRLKPRDERYIIFRVHDEMLIVTEFSPLYMLQYVDKVKVTKEYFVNGNIESEDTDEYVEPDLNDINDNHIIKWLLDNQHLWAKEVVQCLQRA